MGTKPLEGNGVWLPQGRAGPQTRCCLVVDGHRIGRAGHGREAPTQPGYAFVYPNLGKGWRLAGTPTPPTSRGRPDPDAARALYQRHADSYDLQTDWAGDDRARVVDLLGLEPGDTVLDV